MSDLEFNMGYVPGMIGRIAELHAVYYSRHWSFGSFFEAKVASELSEFVSRYDEARDGLWSVSNHGRIEGSIVIDALHAATEGAHLRWFIVSEALQGKGVGTRLIEEAIAFCRRKKYRMVYLWTFEGLDAARHLYEKVGFKLAEEHPGKQWGKEVKEQCFELRLA